jgi:hypothetical protein
MILNAAGIVGGGVRMNQKLFCPINLEAPRFQVRRYSDWSAWIDFDGDRIVIAPSPISPA